MEQQNNHSKPASKAKILPCRVAFRISSEQKALLEKNASLCGLNPSDYARKCIFKGTPKQRMTPKEREAFLTLSDVRGDLIHFMNVLKGKSQEERLRFFRNYAFFLEWKNIIESMIKRLTQILSYLSE